MESPLRNIAPKDLKIIETIRFDPTHGFTRLALHVDRAEATAAKLGIEFDRGNFLMTLGGAVDELPARCRVTIDMQGEIGVTTAELNANAPLWNLQVSKQRLRSDDPWLQVKTTERHLYETTRADMPTGIDEMIFLNEKDEVCEGTITNIFAQIAGKLVTPPITAGVLSGALRQELIDTGETTEGKLTLDDLYQADKIYVGNSLRGLIPAKLLKGDQ